jgi:uncharacterized protein YndB with AHSA1/START domain
VSAAIDTPLEPAFTLCRTFDVPREQVFAAWTEAEQLARWFGPKGLTMLSCTLDLRPRRPAAVTNQFPFQGDMT